MARKGWGALSPGYRARLEKNGISRQDYEAGTSIRKARGHEHTPERPSSYDRTIFVQYARNRGSLIRQLEEKKEELFGGRPRWKEERSKQNIRDYPPSIAQLKWAVNEASESDLIDAIREDPKAFAWIGY